MVGIQGIGGTPEPRPERPANVRDRRDADLSRETPSQDGVVISSEAQAAARVASTIQEAQNVPDVRTERVEAARAAIERGDFRRPDVVAQVAERISRIYLAPVPRFHDSCLPLA